MQRLQRGILLSTAMSSFKFFAVAGTNNGSQIEQVRAFWIDRLFLDSPRIHVLSGLQRIDRKKRLALVLERGGDWSLESDDRASEVLRRRRRTGALVEFYERAIRRERFRMSLFFVKLLKDLPTSINLATALRSPSVSLERSRDKRIVCVLSMIGWLFSSGQYPVGKSLSQ